MKSSLRYIVSAIIVLSIIAFMTTYSVRFTETAVVTTFGKAGEDSVRKNAGLGFKWPAPIQSVTKYDTRPRLVETKPETSNTKDERQLVMQTFMTWRVTDPLKFYQRYSGDSSRPEDHYARAEETLRAQLRAAMGQTSTFKLGDLLSTTDAGSKLGELEATMLEKLRADAKNSDAGIEVLSVGVNSIELPQATTKQVFDRMKQTRDTLAAEALNQGQALAESIKAQADSDARKILAFAEKRATAIRSQGDQEAAQFYEMQNTSPELAVFLQQLDFLKRSYSKKGTTLILPMNTPGFNLLSPGAAEKLQSGKIPGAADKPGETRPADGGKKAQ